MEKGVSVWLRDAESDEWHRAVVVKLAPQHGDANDVEATLRLQEGPKARSETTLRVDVRALEEEKIEGTLLANSADMDVVEDLIQLPHLHEPGICHTLNERFKINEIYTLTGEILLALNPFKNIGIYSDKVIRKYIRHGDKRSLGHELPDMPPHVFAIADKAYRSLASPLTSADKHSSAHNNQSILVSGESGAGKTESTKFVMQYLAIISQQASLGNSMASSGRRKSSVHSVGSSDTSVMDQVLSSNPILESFGNARTIRNDNSSRFGKFIKMEFSSTPGANGKVQLVGATIQTYLLEKVRLAYQAEAERNYHVFYEILAGASAVEKERWKLMAPTRFHYLNQSTCVKRRDGVDDAEQFRVLKSAMRTMGFDDERMQNIFATVAALLHLGNLEFDDVDNASGADGSKISDSKQTKQSIDVVLEFFGCDRETLQKALCQRQITAARDETYTIELPANEAENTRDAFARFMYGKLFDWLVARINDTVSYQDDFGSNSTSFIGLLDIFGFEDLAHNSFEQLCINYANETLQQHFNLTVLRLEQETYEREQIAWSFINFPDNGPCIALIESKPFGILPALDEECVVPQGNDQNFARKLYRQHEKNAHFSASKTEKANHLFVVHHYAGQVTYDSFGFCEKNKDVLYSEITNLMQRREAPEFVRELISSGAVVQANNARRKSSVPVVKGRAASSAASSKQSLGAQFRTQLRQLIDTINVTTCHYVRCIKPNDSARSDVFVPKRVCDQLRAGGVLEAVRVNRAGYPVRIFHQQFLKRYRPLLNGAYLRRLPEEAGTDDAYDSEERKQAASLLADFLRRAYVARYPDLVTKSESKDLEEVIAGGVGIQVGLTRVFFRRSAIQFVEAQLAKRYGELVVLIQAAARGLIQRRRYAHAKESLVVIQKHVRGFITRCRFYVLREKKRRAEAEKRRLEEERRAKMAREERERLEAEERARKEAEDRERRIKLKQEAEEAERRRQMEARVSDPVSDDSSDENNKSLMATPPTGASRQTRGASRFRFTKDYSPDLDDPRATFDATNDGPRQVAMEPGDTVLHVAANCCHEQDVLKLLQNGADINARNRRGRTPLHTASHYGNVEVVGILLDWEADVLVQDDDGNTPLHLSRDARIARMLLEAGCTPNIVNADGRTALIDAVDRGDTSTVKQLLRFKADVLFRELKHHQTALHLAVRKGHYQIVMELCKSEEIENLILLTDRNENNCLHFAVSRDRKNGVRLVDYLIKHGGEVNKVNARLQTPLVVHIMTTRQTDPAITELFLSRGADANVPLADGSSLLHVAVERELVDVACALIRHGSNMNQPDAKGRLVVDVANKKILKKLFSAIALPPTWIDEKARRACMLCSSNFKFGSRKHHCRHCGRVCCSDCSSFTVELFRFPKDFPGRAALGNGAANSKAAKEPQRVCRTCHAVFKMRTAQKESKSGFMARVLGYEWDEVTEMH